MIAILLSSSTMIEMIYENLLKYDLEEEEEEIGENWMDLVLGGVEIVEDDGVT